MALVSSLMPQGGLSVLACAQSGISILPPGLASRQPSIDLSDSTSDATAVSDVTCSISVSTAARRKVVKKDPMDTWGEYYRVVDSFDVTDENATLKFLKDMHMNVLMASPLLVRVKTGDVDSTKLKATLSKFSTNLNVWLRV